jgi:hypothetical protein
VQLKLTSKEKEIAAMVTMLVAGKYGRKYSFSCRGEVFAVDSSLLMGDPIGPFAVFLCIMPL